MEPQKDGEACWRRIGVFGDATCTELQKVSHCSNCPVYTTAGRGLLERAAPEGYLEEWTAVLTKEKEAEPSDTTSILIFRLGGEWLALPTPVVSEVTEVRTIHSVPQRRHSILMGLVNIQGEIQLCVSVSELLGIERNNIPSRPTDLSGYQRMVVVERERTRWVFPVDEVYGVSQFSLGALHDVPATVAQASGPYTKGTLTWQEKRVGYLDEERLFDAFKRHIS